MNHNYYCLHTSVQNIYIHIYIYIYIYIYTSYTCENSTKHQDDNCIENYKQTLNIVYIHIFNCIDNFLGIWKLCLFFLIKNIIFLDMKSRKLHLRKILWLNNINEKAQTLKNWKCFSPYSFFFFFFLLFCWCLFFITGGKSEFFLMVVFCLPLLIFIYKDLLISELNPDYYNTCFVTQRKKLSMSVFTHPTPLP